MYHGTEDFKNDTTVDETYEDLFTKYNNAYEESKKLSSSKLKFTTNNDNNDDTIVLRNIAALMREEDLNTDIPFKQPLWRSPIKGDSLMSSERYDNDNSRSMAELGQRVGYNPSMEHHFGPTNARSGA